MRIKSETNNSYSVRISTADLGRLWYDEAITITRAEVAILIRKLLVKSGLI